MTDTRSCTCHPDDNPPSPCQHKFSLTECKDAEIAELRAERDEANRAYELIDKHLRNITEKVIPDLQDERNAAREVLQEARDAWQDGYFSGWTPEFVDRIDAALNGEKNNGIS